VQMKKALETTANVVLIVAAIVFLGTRGHDLWKSRTTPSLALRSNALLGPLDVIVVDHIDIPTLK
jgi:hypothetical protein